MSERPDIEELLTPLEVAALFGVDPKTVTRWARTGKLPVAGWTIGGHRRYRKSDVERLLGGGAGPRDEWLDAGSPEGVDNLVESSERGQPPMLSADERGEVERLVTALPSDLAKRVARDVEAAEAAGDLAALRLLIAQLRVAVALEHADWFQQVRENYQSGSL